ncbi:probable serine/threonine-protein kinase yakA [Leguminivora glycinivorella]|uniref:probable serine/threonine-protein kinase yakA n=1 Tax=Leguminivora glycinivorella TaxID=1035111 RepID=UPI00200C6A4D|nr:probable serine/threonine-protein kinase yakA [Leguminivora glycinivorella]
MYHQIKPAATAAATASSSSSSNNNIDDAILFVPVQERQQQQHQQQHQQQQQQQQQELTSSQSPTLLVSLTTCMKLTVQSEDANLAVHQPKENVPPSIKCERSHDEYESIEPELVAHYENNKKQWIRAFQNNYLIKQWRLPMPLNHFRGEVSRLMKHQYIQGNIPSDDEVSVYFLTVMWDEINDEVEGVIGNESINFQDWFFFLCSCNVEV